MIDFSHSLGKINRNIYGHFAEQIGGVIHGGLWVGKDSKVENIHGFRKTLVDSFKKLTPPVVRWPGGCFAETYNWRDGIGAPEKRPKRVNWWYYEDGRFENNQVGTHEMMDFCRMVGAEPYFAANMTSVPALHVRDWIEYCNFPTGSTTLAEERERNGSKEPFAIRYWGIGNENWGGGGQMSPEMCAREFIRYTTICRSLGTKDLRFIMCGANGHDLDWTTRLMREWQRRPWQEVATYGMSLHYYVHDMPEEDPVNFTEENWYKQVGSAAFMEHIVDDHRAAMDPFDPERKIKLIIDEWGSWHRSGFGPSKGRNLYEQQSNMRDAVVAALTLNIFNNRCDVVAMTNVAQLCNNLHALYLADGEHCVETPTYHVFDMFKPHQEARQLKTLVSSAAIALSEGKVDSLSVSASIKEDVLTLTLANLDLSTAKNVRLSGIGRELAGEGEWTVLTHKDPSVCNTFDAPDVVRPVGEAFKAEGEEPMLVLPAASVGCLRLKLAKA